MAVNDRIHGEVRRMEVRKTGFLYKLWNILMPFAASSCAVHKTCSSVSALQGPAITRGRSAVKFSGTIGCRFSIVVCVCLVNVCLFYVSDSFKRTVHVVFSSAK